MRRAEWIANRLLEAVPDRRPAAPRGAVYVLSGNSGRDYDSMEAYARALLRDVQPQPDEGMVRQAVNDAINRGAVIVEQPDFSKLTVYAKDVPVPVSTEQLRYMQHRFNVLYPNTIGFSRDINRLPVPVKFDRVFAATKAVDQELRTREKLQKQAEKADKELAKLKKEQGKTAPQAPQAAQAQPQDVQNQHGSWFNPPGWKQEFEKEYGVNPDELETGYTERTPEPEQQNPYDMGIEYDHRYRQRGVLVARIVPGGPAAASVLQAGDIIRKVGPFETRSGVVAGPYRIDKATDLQRTLSWLRGGTAFPMDVVRGSNYVSVVVMPQLKNKPNAPTT